MNTTALHTTSADAGKKDRRAHQPIEALQIPDALLKTSTVVAVTGLSASQIQRKVLAGTFPAPVRLGTRCTRFVAGSVRAWLTEPR